MSLSGHTFSGRPKRKRMSEINVVPYIDVMLVLLVIFMVTAPMLHEGVKVDLPATRGDVVEQSGQEPIVVTVDAKGQVYLNLGEPHKALDGKTLLTRIKALLRHRPQATIYVKGDRQVPYGEVVKVMALLKRGGVERVGLVTRLPDET
ncbi:protein TolR [Thiolapillus sp.]